MSNSAISEETWDDFEKRIFTPEEIAACESRVAITWEIRDARQRGIRKHDLEKLSGVNAAVISRMEEDPAKARLGPLLKVLTALGKALAVVPMEEVLKGDDSSNQSAVDGLQL